MDMNEIMARLDAGESADVIAQEMADMLNKAQAVRAENLAKSEKEAQLDALMADVLKSLYNYFKAVDVDGDWDFIMEVPVAEVREGLDELVPLANIFCGTKVKTIKVPKTSKPAEDVFAKFFRELGI